MRMNMGRISFELSSDTGFGIYTVELLGYNTRQLPLKCSATASTFENCVFSFKWTSIIQSCGDDLPLPFRNNSQKSSNEPFML